MVSIAATHAPHGAYKQVLPGVKDTATTTGTPTESPSDDAALPLRDLPPRRDAGGNDLPVQQFV